MPIMAKASGSNFIPAPEGQWPAVCCDVVDLGILEVTFGGQTKHQHKIRIVWQISEDKPDGKPFTVSKRYTLSLHEKSTLRKDLESWRGRKFTAKELEGFDVETVLSVPAFLNVIQEERDGTTYSNVSVLMKLPKGMPAPTVREYVRVCERPPAEAVAEPAPPDDPYAHIGITDDDVPF